MSKAKGSKSPVISSSSGYSKTERYDLVMRMLGLRHKIKVHESMKAPETHDDLAMMLLTKWEMEDEVAAIEQILADARQENVASKKKLIIKQLDE